MTLVRAIKRGNMISNSFFNYDRSSHSLGSKVYHVLNEYPPCPPYWFSMNREDLGLKDPLHCSTHARSLSLSRGRHFAGKRVSSRKFSPFFVLFSRLRYFIFKLTCIPRRFIGIFSKAKRISAAFWKNSWVFL